MVSRPRCGGHLSQRDKPLVERDNGSTPAFESLRISYDSLSKIVG